MHNADERTVRGFGEEWAHFDQSALDATDRHAMFEQYFGIFPWSRLPADAVGLDLGCGSGRWATLVAKRVKELHCVDASDEALAVARNNLRDFDNCVFHHASVESIPLADESMDFAYALGVLHHVPDTAAGIRACVRTLKRGAPFLAYLYYAFDNRPQWFRRLWQVSNAARVIISRMPFGARLVVSQAVAAGVYLPLARGAALLERTGIDVDVLPLSIYRHRSFYCMRTDALDRFGTRLERRFTAEQIREMMVGAGLENVRFSDGPPYWCVVGEKA
ncbi:MAG: class I SAM-dependent methyltransferase [Myxococcota bacterium]|nr:class I SAM-dependent methyltransferase [Myxococcota bacterium]